MKISSMTLSGYRAGASATEGWLALTINLEAGKTVSGPANVSRMLEISVRTDASKKIISCIATGGAGSGGYWIATPSFNGIYFSGGKVGVGTSSPAADLHVVGNIAAGNYLGGVGNTNSALGLYSDDSLQNGYQAWGAGTTNPNSLALVTNGNVQLQVNSVGNFGIGSPPGPAKLHVAGDIRPGNQVQAPNCSAANQGAIRYNETSAAMEFCGGSPIQWRVMAATAPTGTLRAVYQCPHHACDNNSASSCSGQLSFDNFCYCRRSNYPDMNNNRDYSCLPVGKLLLQL